MASPAPAQAAATGQAASLASNQTTSNASKPLLKPSLAGNRAGDVSRKQSNSPVDNAQRRTPTPKAWTQGNPAIYKAAQQTNGSSSQKTSPKPPTADGNAEKQGHDRLMLLFSHLTGRSAVVTIKSGDQYIGIFAGSSKPSGGDYVLKMTKRLKTSTPRANGAEDNVYEGNGTDFSMVFDAKDVVDMCFDNVPLTDKSWRSRNGPPSGFRTDTDISASGSVRERTLQKWEAGPDDSDTFALDGSSSNQHWDQFATNERITGMQSNYDESFYTTTINRNDPNFKQREAAAERLAREIESGITTNTHIAEERGQKQQDDSGMDEEDKYSGVIRGAPGAGDSGVKKYMPPARRPPTGQPTVRGAPVDPAIISSQLAAPVPADTSKSTAKPSVAPMPVPVPQPVPVPEVNAAKPVEPAAASSTTKPHNQPPTDYQVVRDAGKLFVNQEKLKVDQNRKKMMKAEKDIKMNDLVRFSQTFKLNTPVPKDLVPILAKDKEKQDEIIERSKRAEVEAEMRSRVAAEDAKRRLVAVPDRRVPSAVPGNLQSQTLPHRGGLGQRLAHPQPKASSGSIPPPIPQGLKSPADRSANSSRSGSAASTLPVKFNAKALEFRPNPSAAAFTPSGTTASVASSPRSNVVSSHSRVATPPVFFTQRRPVAASERPVLLDSFNPIKRARTEYKKLSAEDKAQKSWIRPATKYAVVWDTTDENREHGYSWMFDQQLYNQQVPAQAPNVHVPQQPPFVPHGMPFQGQGHPVSTSHHHASTSIPSFDEHRMMPSMSSSGSVLPSPHLHNANVAYQSPMNQQAHLVYQQQMPQYMIGGMPQNGQFRQYAGGPQFVPQPGQMGHIVHGPGGLFMGIQGMPVPMAQMQMYSPSPHQAYPHNMGANGSNGYPSPGRGAPMMMHQGSQQGHQQGMMVGMPQGGYYAQGPNPGMMRYPSGQFGSSPLQGNQFPMQHQHRGGPNHNFNQGGQAMGHGNSSQSHAGQPPHPAELTEETK